MQDVMSIMVYKSISSQNKQEIRVAESCAIEEINKNLRERGTNLCKNHLLLLKLHEHKNQTTNKFIGLV